MTAVIASIFILGSTDGKWVLADARLESSRTFEAELHLRSSDGPFAVLYGRIQGASSRSYLVDLRRRVVTDLPVDAGTVVDASSSPDGRKLLLTLRKTPGSFRFIEFADGRYRTVGAGQERSHVVWVGSKAVVVAFQKGIGYRLAVGDGLHVWRSKGAQFQFQFLVAPMTNDVYAIAYRDLWKSVRGGWTKVGRGPFNALCAADPSWSPDGRFLVLAAAFHGETPGQERYALRRFDTATGGWALVRAWNEDDAIRAAGVSSQGQVMYYSTVTRQINMWSGSESVFVKSPLELDILGHVWWNCRENEGDGSRNL